MSEGSGVERETRILHLISSGGLLGAEHVLLELAQRTQSEGGDVAIGVFQNLRNPNAELAEEARRRGFEVRVFPCRGRFDRKTISKIRDYIGEKSVNILHSHNYKSNFYAWMARPRNGTRWVVTNHGRRQGYRLSLYHFLDSVVMRRADKVVAVSERIAEWMAKAGVRKDRLSVIDNGIDVDGFLKRTSDSYPLRLPGARANVLLIGTVGSLTKEKGHVNLLNAVPRVLRHFPEAQFLIVGNGVERSALERLAEEKGITESVVFTGARDDIPGILSSLDAFVLPSLDEGLPMALLEAQAACIPVVATEVGAVPSVVRNGVTGLLVPPGDADALAQALVRILSDSRAASRMAEKGRERVRERFSSHTMAEKYHSLYEDIMANGRE
jgi:glycosyltransferase involved in cell wall biosynthesis